MLRIYLLESKYRQFLQNIITISVSNKFYTTPPKENSIMKHLTPQVNSKHDFKHNYN